MRKIQAAYLNDLISLGVSGFRIDAAMWMDPVNLITLFSSLKHKPYLVQEVSYSEGNPVTPQLYTGVRVRHPDAKAKTDPLLRSEMFMNFELVSPSRMPSSKVEA